MVDEYQDTNRPQYLLMRRLAEAHRNLCRGRRPRPVHLQVARRRPAQHHGLRARLPRRRVVRLEQNYRSTQVILDAASAVISQQPQPQGEAALDRARRAATRSRYYRVDDELEEADVHRARRAQASVRDDRRHADGRALPHQRAVARRSKTRCGARASRYRIIGGVRFYERKEVKDALAYLKLLINPTTT